MPVSLGMCKGIVNTGDALLVEACRGNDALDGRDKKQIWIPLSVLEEENECHEFERGEVFVRTWWAENEGLE
jgi:hypothetical protein